MRTIKPFSLTALALLGIFSVGVTGCNKPAPSEPPFATVNGAEISEKEFLSFLERKPTVQVSTPQGDQEVRVAGILGLQALRDIVNRKLLVQLAKEEGVTVTDEDVEKELKFQQAQPGSFVSSLITQGLPAESIKEDVRISLIRERIQTKGITVSPKEVEDYVKQNQDQFMEPAKASMLWMVVSDPKKKSLADKDLKAGQSFETVAVRYSEAPNARQENAKFMVEEIDKMPPQLQSIVAKLSPNKASDWITEGNNAVKFFLVSKSPKKKMVLTADQTESLRRSLALQKGSATINLGEKVTAKLKAADIKVNDPEMKEAWAKIFALAKEQLAQEDAAKAAATQPGPAPTNK